MTQPIYKVFVVRPTEAWHQLSSEQQESNFAKNNAAFEAVGGKYLIVCDSRWTSDEWSIWGVAEFPDFDAVLKYSDELTRLNWFRYFEGFSSLGTKMSA